MKEKFFRYIWWLTLPVLFLVMFTILRAQITQPTPIDFEILDPDERPTYECYGEIQWENLRGTTVRGVTAEIDSVRRSNPMGFDVLDDEEWRWVIVVDSMSFPAAPTDTGTVYVTVEEMRRRDKYVIDTLRSGSYRYVDSLNCHKTGAEVLNTDFIPGINLLVRDSSNVAVNDSIDLVFLRRTFDKHWIRELAIHPSDGIEDTLLAASGAVPTMAASNEYEYLNLKVYARGITADTVLQVGLGYMVKKEGDAYWAGDGNDATVLKDSTYKYDSDFTMRANAWNHLAITHVASDSIYFIFYGVCVTGRNIIEEVVIEQHN